MRKFDFYKSPVRNTHATEQMTIPDAYRYITTSDHALSATHSLRDIILKVKRGEAPASEARTYKAQHFDFCTFSGTFRRRSDEELIQHSGFICLDFDHVGSNQDVHALRQRLIDDAYFTTLLAFVSPSGDGLKWVVSIDLARGSHAKWFGAIARYVEATYGISTDQQCANVSRACFLPFDATCYAHPIAVEMAGGI